MANVGEPTYLTDLTNRSGTIGVRCTQATAQTGLTDAAYSTLTFTAEDFNWGTLHDTGTNTSRINIGTKLGLWLVGATAVYAQTASTYVRHAVHLTQNGTAINGSISSIGIATAQLVTMSTPIVPVLATVSTDYVETQALVDVSPNNTWATAVSGEARSSFWAFFIGTQ